MYISNKRFKIVEAGVNDFKVYVEVPKYKKTWYGRAYYDGKDLIWAIVGSDGNLIMKGSQVQPATFRNMTTARQFVADIKAIKEEKRETIVD